MTAYVVYMETQQSQEKEAAAAEAIRQIKGVVRVVERTAEAAAIAPPKTTEATKLSYTVPEAARELSISPALLREEIAQGSIAVVRFGKRVVVPRWALEERLGRPGVHPDVEETAWRLP